MTNKEKYQRTFSVLHASGDFLKEATPMKNQTKRYRPRLAVVCAAVILILGMMTAAYAADLGGIQRTIQLWTHGDQTNAVLDIQDGSYTVTYEDSNGSSHEFGGGGVAFDIFGNERPLTEAEIMEHLDEPEVEVRDDGTIWVYFRSHVIEITDKFDAEGYCYVTVQDGSDVRYLTVEQGGGYAMSPKKYVDPSEFSAGS